MRIRPRRLRQSDAMRGFIRETRLSPEQLVMPLFVRPGQRIRTPIPSMPGQFQFSVDQLVEECRQLHELRVPGVLLFGSADRKDEQGSRAWANDGLIQEAVRAIKARVPELLVITDVCLCAYTSHGHCGIVKHRDKGQVTSGKKNKSKSVSLSPVTGHLSPAYVIDNDATVELLAKTALSHTKAGADLVAPSDMMDGTVGAIRGLLDEADFERVGILAYSVKYASSFYGPFREAVGSAPAFGDRRTYQMDAANHDEALREARLDLEQGADILMVKPALAYLDIITLLKAELRAPVAAFNVSGEYAMVKASAARGWLVERSTWLEMLLAMTRAGADILITYWAKDAAKLMKTHEF